MPRSLAITLVVAIAGAVVSAAVPARAASPEFDACLSRAMSDAQAAACDYDESARQRARMDALFASLLAAQPSATDRQRLQWAQDAWVAYRDAHCAWSYALPWGDMPQALIAVACVTEQNEIRADDLDSLLPFFDASLGAGGPGKPSADGFIFPDSDRRLLTRAELQPLSRDQLRLARNEIFARRGYIFSSADLRTYFGAQPWYRPTSRQVALSTIEQANVDLIRSFE